MRKFVLFSALFLGLHLQAQFTVSDAVPIDKDESILASCVTVDGHYYVITGSKTFSTVNGKTVGTKVNVFHFDDQIKLVAQKKVKRPDFGTAPLQITSLYEVGTMLILFGYSEDLARGISKVGFTSIDKASLEIASKMSEIQEIKSGGYFGGGKPYFEFNQTEPGKSVAFMMESLESVPQRNGFSMEKSTHYFMVDTKLMSHKCYSFSNSDDPYDQENAGFIVSASGVLNFIVMEREHVNLIGEWYKDERQLRKMNLAKLSAKLYSYSPETKKLEKSVMTFQDSTLWTGHVRLTEFGNKIFIGGIASNSAFIIQKYFANDTIGLPGSAEFCFLHSIAPGGPNVILRTECVKIESAFMKKLSTSDKISKEDRSLGATDGFSLSSVVVTGEGSVIFTGESYVQSKHPPYEKIKNDKAYKISKDDEGNITSISTTKFTAGMMRHYLSLFRMSVNLTAKTCQTKMIDVDFISEIPDLSNHKYAFVPGVQTGASGNIYFDDKNGNDIKSWDGTETVKTFSFSHSGSAHIDQLASPNGYFKYMVVREEKAFWLMKVQ